MQKRTHLVGEVFSVAPETQVTLMGWVERQRDLGSLVFFRLRDRWGSLQVRANESENADAHAVARKLRAEFVVSVSGVDKLRPENERKDEPGGDRELVPESIEILGESKTPPFYITGETPSDDVLRMQYRYLDLRRPPMVRIIEIRHRAFFELRKYLDSLGFWEIETPILTKSTPEGARDYLVPSRVQPGMFYALPQSPQLLKQTLMIAGTDRYFQLSRCFRDEDLRADRQPEFTQLDLEMSFVTRDELFEVGEGSMAHIFKEAIGVEVKRPFPVYTYEDVMARFGTDKPDIRFGCEIRDFSGAISGTEFRVFAKVLESGGAVKGVFVPDAKPSRKEEDELDAFVRKRGGGGLALLRVQDGEPTGALAKFVDGKRLKAMQEVAGATADGTFMLMAGEPNALLPVLGELRVHVAEIFNVPKADGFHFCWVVDFPLYEPDEETGEPVPMHHAFTSPLVEDIEFLESDPLKVRADSYDMVMNGVELGSGSLRVFEPELQRRILRNLGMTDDEITARFGFLLKAYGYGGPPHRGFALGLDRIIALMAGTSSIRDVIAFPKTTSAQCPLTGAPSEVSDAQLAELKLKKRDGG